MCKILIVDEDEDCRSFLEVSLREEGHDVKTASSLIKAIETGERFRPDLLVTGWVVSGGDNGPEVAKTLWKTSPGMSVIFLSGLPAESFDYQADQLPNSKLIPHPATFGLIEGLVKEHIAQRILAV